MFDQASCANPSSIPSSKCKWLYAFELISFIVTPKNVCSGFIFIWRKFSQYTKKQVDLEYLSIGAVKNNYSGRIFLLERNELISSNFFIFNKFRFLVNLVFLNFTHLLILYLPESRKSKNPCWNLTCSCLKCSTLIKINSVVLNVD